MPTGQAKALRRQFAGPQWFNSTPAFWYNPPTDLYVHRWQKPESWGENNKNKCNNYNNNATSHWRAWKSFQTLSYKLSHPEDTLHKRLFYFLLSSHYDSDYFLFSSNLLLYFLFPTHFALSSITLKNRGRHFRAESTPRNFELCEVAEPKVDTEARAHVLQGMWRDDQKTNG